MSKRLFIRQRLGNASTVSDNRHPQATRLSRGRGRLDELDEDSVRIDREHEPSKRTLNGLRADAEEPVARILRAIDQRVEAAHLELELRRADVLKPPVEPPGRSCGSGRQRALRQ